ncbi:hypothetical protein Tco_1085578 [Tanacetum coccineum]
MLPMLKVLRSELEMLEGILKTTEDTKACTDKEVSSNRGVIEYEKKCVPKLASTAEYFSKMGVEGNRFRPTALRSELEMLEGTLTTIEDTVKKQWWPYGQRSPAKHHSINLCFVALMAYDCAKFLNAMSYTLSSSSSPS